LFVFLTLLTYFSTHKADSLAQSAIGPAIELLNSTIPQSNVNLDVGLLPNSFASKHVAGGHFIDDKEGILQLVDGSFDGENVPFQPLLVKARGLDVIMAIDAVSGCIVYSY
jgi:lysophospholipase